MSSDPGAPEIKEVETPPADASAKEPSHYNLIPVESSRTPDRIQDIQRSISRQETTLSSIMNMIGDSTGDQTQFSYDDMNFDEFTAA